MLPASWMIEPRNQQLSPAVIQFYERSIFWILAKKYVFTIAPSTLWWQNMATVNFSHPNSSAGKSSISKWRFPKMWVPHSLFQYRIFHFQIIQLLGYPISGTPSLTLITGRSPSHRKPSSRIPPGEFFGLRLALTCHGGLENWGGLLGLKNCYDVWIAWILKRLMICDMWYYVEEFWKNDGECALQELFSPGSNRWCFCANWPSWHLVLDDRNPRSPEKPRRWHHPHDCPVQSRGQDGEILHLKPGMGKNESPFHALVGGCPLKNMKVSWDDYFQDMERNGNHPHQPVPYSRLLIYDPHFGFDRLWHPARASRRKTWPLGYLRFTNI